MATPTWLNRIVWGVEAFSEERALQNKTAHALRAITSRTEVEIEPVYVLSPDQLRLPVEALAVNEPHYSFENFAEHSREVAAVVERSLGDWLRSVELPRLLPPRLLIQEEFSLRASVHALVAYAEASRSDWIAVSTHARAGLSRFLLGSFSETLVYQSHLPVLVVGPEADLGELEQIIVPTDFTPTSRDVFERATALARVLGVELILFHKVFHLSRYVSTFRQDGPDLARRMRYAEIKKEQAEDWVEWARAEGARAQVVIDDRPGDVPAAILERAKESPSAMIVLASQTGPVASAILGSVTRHVVRHASCPVLVVHPPKAP